MGASLAKPLQLPTRPERHLYEPRSSCPGSIFVAARVGDRFCTTRAFLPLQPELGGQSRLNNRRRPDTRMVGLDIGIS